MKTGILRFFRRLRYKLLWARFYIYKFYSDKKWQLLHFYYIRLLHQANFLYRQSDLFKLRWQEFGLDFAEKFFDSDAKYFLWKAKNQPFRIRWQLFLDGLLNRELQTYYFKEEME